MLVYPKIAHEVMPIRAIFMLCCGCDVKNLGPAMLVYPKMTSEVVSFRAIFIVEVYAYLVVAVTCKILVQPCWFMRIS